MASPEAWYRANQVLGYYMLGSQVVAVIAADAVAGRLSSLWGWDRITGGVLWVCAASLIGIAASFVHVYSRD